jgi:hypothetical protein
VVDNANEKGKRKGPRAVTSSVSGRVELRVEKKDQDTLQVTILQAKDLRAMDLGQKNDVFIEVVLVTSANVDGRETPLKKEQKKQTTTQTNAGSSATWGKDGEGETLEFGLAEHLEDDESDSTMTYKLVIQAWDEDPAEKVNDLIGEGRRGIDHLVKLPVGSAVQNWCEVVDRDYGITQFFTRLESQARFVTRCPLSLRRVWCAESKRHGKQNTIFPRMPLLLDFAEQPAEAAVGYLDPFAGVILVILYPVSGCFLQ